MTNTRTPAETNEAIALLRGWVPTIAGWVCPNENCPRCMLVEFNRFHKDPPNFLGEWEHAGPLQVEMWKAGFDLWHDDVDGTFYWSKVSKDGSFPLNNDRDETTDVMVATGLDWLAWKEKR